MSISLIHKQNSNGDFVKLGEYSLFNQSEGNKLFKEQDEDKNEITDQAVVCASDNEYAE